MTPRSHPFGDYIIYVDESGDHGLSTIDSEYPIFVLAFCIFKKEDYLESATPSLQSFKFEMFGHDMVVLHEREIRKRTGEFGQLVDPAFRTQFFSSLNRVIEEAPFTLIAAVIRKADLVARYSHPQNPYEISMLFCLERLWYYLRSQGQEDVRTHLVVESRGRNEDRDLELEFRRICAGGNANRSLLPFEIVFSHKMANSCGLQLADLVARPIGRRVIDPSQPNRAFDVLEKKFHRDARGDILGYGLKIFP